MKTNLIINHVENGYVAIRQNPATNAQVGVAVFTDPAKLAEALPGLLERCDPPAEPEATGGQQ